MDKQDGVDLIDDYENMVPPYDENDEFGEGANAPGESNTTGNKVTTYTGVHTTSFRDFLLKSELSRAITECGFEHPSEVQQKCIPAAVSGEDILCQAVSGMGKTAVFILSILNQIDETDPKPASALILCNTRELSY